MEKTYQTLKLILFILIFIAILLGAWVLYQRLGSAYQPQALVTETTQSTGSAPEKNTAPDFTVEDRQGNPVSLSDFQGKPVILNFWASWCGPCKSEMPAFEDAYQAYGEDIHFVMVNLTDGSRETVEGAAAYIDDQGYTFPIYFDTGYSGAIAYNVSAIPATYFIDAQGNQVLSGRGALSAETLQSGIDLLLAE